MPKYTIVVRADHTGTGHSVEYDAATPWLALEKSHARLKWLSADLLEDGRTLARVDHLPFQKAGVWQISPPPQVARATQLAPAKPSTASDQIVPLDAQAA